MTSKGTQLRGTAGGIWSQQRVNCPPVAGAYPAVMSVPSARVRPMRLLHTSDWHLGRSLHRADLRAAQSAFLDHLVEVARAEKVDAVLVAGDIYDRAVPPVDAVELCEDALLRLHDTGARIVLISGNHDSARWPGRSCWRTPTARWPSTACPTSSPTPCAPNCPRPVQPRNQRQNGHPVGMPGCSATRSRASGPTPT